MSDLVRNPNCWFSYAQAHIWFVLYQGGDNETSFGDESGGETEPLLPPPVGNNATRTRTPGRSDAIQISFRSDTKEISMEVSKDAIEIDLVEPQEKKQGITRERIFVVLTILLTELCERLTYYSVVANMVLFCTSVLDMSSDDASVVTLIFSGLYYRIHDNCAAKLISAFVFASQIVQSLFFLNPKFQAYSLLL